jgi:cytochrome c biogenesis protein ResB
MKKNLLIFLLTLLLGLNGVNALAQNVIAIQKGPNDAFKGENITIQYTITNNGNQSIYNVSVMDQNFYKFLDTLQPGESQKFEEQIYIPTDQEVKEDFGSNATVSNPFFIGGVAVSYQDAVGNTYTVNSNSISIPLTNKNIKNNKNETTNVSTGNHVNQQQGILKSLLNILNSIYQSIVQFVQGLF